MLTSACLVTSFNSFLYPSKKSDACVAVRRLRLSSVLPVKADSIMQLPLESVAWMVVMAVLALSVKVKTQMEMIPITAAKHFEAVEILITVEGVNSSLRGTPVRLWNLTSDIVTVHNPQLCERQLFSAAASAGASRTAVKCQRTNGFEC